MSTSLPQAKLLPWGRLVQTPDEKNVYFELSRSKHCVGRVANRCDIQIPLHFISGLHCVIRLRGKDDRGEPIVELEDVSRYGVWVKNVKVGNRRKMLLKKGDAIKFTDPKKDGEQLSYRLEILPSGLTQKNQELHARLSADEMSVADRTRKRTHEEIQGTQSPTKVVRSPPRPRPVKKMRQVTQSSQEEESQPAGELANTSTTQHVTSAPAAGKRRRRADVPAPDSKIAELQQENERLKLLFAENSLALSYTKEQLEKAKQEVKTVREENEALKKSHEEDLAKAKVQAISSQKKEMDELRLERDSLKQTLEHILVDPKAPPQVRSIAELDIKILELQRKIKFDREELTLQSQQESQETPPSKKQLVEKERNKQMLRELVVRQHNQAKNYEKMAQEEKEMAKLTEDLVSDPTNLSGSSQSQDSIDYGNLRNDRRSSQQLLSGCSNENSEPSPGDQLLTVDEESKSGDASQGLFDAYGARRPNTSTDSTTSQPTTLSQSLVFRGRRHDDTVTESKEQPGGAGHEETKGK